MLVRMNDSDVARESDPFARLENLLQKSREKRGLINPAQASAPQAAQQTGAAKDADFSDPNVREAFLGSLRTLGTTESSQEANDALAHHLDPDRVAALLDLD